MSTSSVRPRPRSSGSIKAPNRPPPPPPRSASIQKQAMQTSAILPQRPAPPPNTSPTCSPEKQYNQPNSSVQMEQNVSMSSSASSSKVPNDQIMEKYMILDKNYENLKNIARRGKVLCIYLTSLHIYLEGVAVYTCSIILCNLKVVDLVCVSCILKEISRALVLCNKLLV